MKILPVIALAAFISLGLSCRDQSAGVPKQEIRLAPISVVEVREEDRFFVEQRFVGTVEARRTAHLAFELAGTVEQVGFEEGDWVEAGSVVAVIDSRRLEKRKLELEAALAQANANLDLTRSTAERDERLGASNAISELQVEQSRANLATALADVARIEAQIESVGVDIEKSRLVAPFDGFISQRLVDEGTVVSPGSGVLQLLEARVLEVRAALADDAVAGLAVGDELPVELSRGRMVNLSVARILPDRDSRTRTIDVILSVPENATSLLRAGDIVTVVSERSVSQAGIFLPRDALTESSRGLWACFVASKTEVGTGDDGQPSGAAYVLDRRDVEIVHQYADVVYVRGGIREGDWVMTSGIQKVAPGQNVTVTEVRQSEIEPTLLGLRR